MGSVIRFGTADGADVQQVTIGSASGLSARVLSYGATLRELLAPVRSEQRNVVLSLDTLEAYMAQPMYLGAVPGRYANRIGNARFDLKGKTYQLDANERGNQLHGGGKGFAKRNWTLVDWTSDSATFALVSPDGEMGYPGRLIATCAYSIAGDGLRVALEAFCDRPTPLNLTTHAYFNLDGSSDIRDHRISIGADAITPTDAGLIPTGEIKPVDGTPYDLRSMTRIRDGGIRYDTNFVLRSPGEALSHAVSLRGSSDDLEMQLWTTEPGVQFYDGHLIDWPERGWGPHAGLCLEPQRFPDGPNKAHFPLSILQPGSVSRQISEFRFAAPKEP